MTPITSVSAVAVGDTISDVNGTAVVVRIDHWATSGAKPAGYVRIFAQRTLKNGEIVVGGASYRAHDRIYGNGEIVARV